MVREKTARGGWSGPRERERKITTEKEAEGKRGELCICTYTHTHICIRRIGVHGRVSIVGVASVAADVAAVPRYRRGCLDALHQPSRHDLSALSTTIRYLPSCRGVPSLSASSPRSSIGDASHLRPAALRTLRFVQGRPSVYGACATVRRAGRFDARGMDLARED